VQPAGLLSPLLLLLLLLSCVVLSDSPFRLRNRHNEVWILAAAKPSAQHGTAHLQQQQQQRQQGSWLQQLLGRRAGVAAA
jgi:hypothetical protein